MALLAVLPFFAVLAGCAVGPSQRPPVAVREVGAGSLVPLPAATPPAPPALPPLLPGGAVGLRYRDCTGTVRSKLGGLPPDRDLRFACGSVTSSGLPDDPATINVMRVSLGPVPPDGGVPLVVLGEPDGDPGTLRAARLALRVPVALLRGMVLVGVDGRGASQDDPLDCVPGSSRSAVLDADPSVPDPRQLTDLLGVAQQIAQSCSQVLQRSLQDYDTETAATDLEHVREALGVPWLNAIAIGSASRVLALYAEQFPDSVGRFVLDGAPDPTTDAAGAAEQRAATAEQVFEVFASRCTALPGCPLGRDPRQGLLAVADRLRAQPVPTPDGRHLSAGALFQAVLSGLADPDRWPALAQAIAAAGHGDPSGVLDVLAASGDNGARLDLGLITACDDTSQRLTTGEVEKLVAAWRGRHPLFGPLFAQRLLLCASWPVPIQPPVPGHAAGAPPILVLGTAADPRTPLVGSQHSAENLASARLLTWEGAGHGAYPRTPCVTDATDAFLLQAQLPAIGTVCPP